PVTWLATLAGSSLPVVEELPGLDGEPWLTLTMMKASTITRTASVLPPVIRSRLRRSARRVASRCAAIFSRALCCLILPALPIACPEERVRNNPPAAPYRRRTTTGVSLGPSANHVRMVGSGLAGYQLVPVYRDKGRAGDGVEAQVEPGDRGRDVGVDALAGQVVHVHRVHGEHVRVRSSRRRRGPAERLHPVVVAHAERPRWQPGKFTADRARGQFGDRDGHVEQHQVPEARPGGGIGVVAGDG